MNSEWAMVISTLVLAIVALFGQKFWDWWNKPKIKFGWKNGEPHILTFYSNDGKITKLFRLKVINEGGTIVKNCRIKIISISPKKENFEPDILKWSGVPKDTRYQTKGTYGLVPIDKETKDITPKGGWEFCDLFEIDTREKRIVFISSGRRNFLAEEKDYIVTIEISGDNLEPIKREIKFSILNTFDLAKIEEVKNISQ
jgi:hypothetical protein